MCHSMGPVLPFIPQEVYENVIDHFHDDKAMLPSCGSVCRAWLPSRYHLFGEVKITLCHCDNIARFLELLKSSPSGRSIAPCIRKLTVIFVTGKAIQGELDGLYEALTILRDTTLGYHSLSLHNLPLDFDKLRQILPLWRITDMGAIWCEHQENPELLIFCLFVLFAKNKTKCLI
jgi:hypothetical protein